MPQPRLILNPLIILLVMLASMASAGEAKPGAGVAAAGWTQQPLEQRDQAGESLKYLLFIPKTKPGQRYPLVIHLHGNGGGEDELKGNAPICKVLSAPDWQATRPCFILAPACPQSQTQPKWVNWAWENGSYDIQKVPLSISMQLVLAAIDELCAKQPIDQSRLYITGGSMGGYATWDAICRFPDRFAAAIPLSGAGDPARAPLLKSLPIHAYAIATDPIVPVRGSREMIEAIKAAGGKPLYTEFPEGWHLWDQVWNPGDSIYWQKDLLPWLFDQSRPRPPATKR